MEKECVDEKYLLFLDGLRETGATNMYGATPYLSEAFGISEKEAKGILIYWMETFSERHKNDAGG